MAMNMQSGQSQMHNRRRHGGIVFNAAWHVPRTHFFYGSEVPMGYRRHERFKEILG